MPFLKLNFLEVFHFVQFLKNFFGTLTMFLLFVFFLFWSEKIKHRYLGIVTVIFYSFVNNTEVQTIVLNSCKNMRNLFKNTIYLLLKVMFISWIWIVWLLFEVEIRISLWKKTIGLKFLSRTNLCLTVCNCAFLSLVYIVSVSSSPL